MMKTNLLPTSWVSHAPGSLMLFGEHAVLHGYPAIACAIDNWLHIHWQRRDDQQLIIHSSFAQYQTTWSQLEAHPKLSFVVTLLKHFQATYPEACICGLSIEIKSDINSTQGLGSSSAVVAAMVTGLAKLTNKLNDIAPRFQLGLDTIRTVQGTGSGTDLAAALSGGIMHFTPTTQKIQRLADNLAIVSIYCGYKTPTAQVIQHVEQKWPNQHPLFRRWLNWITDLTNMAAQAITENDNDMLGRCMDMAHGLMHGLGVSDNQLDQLTHQLRETPGIYGAKISGSGLGDCVIGLGKPETQLKHALNIHTTALGAYCSQEVFHHD